MRDNGCRGKLEEPRCIARSIKIVELVKGVRSTSQSVDKPYKQQALVVRRPHQWPVQQSFDVRLVKHVLCGCSRRDVFYEEELRRQGKPWRAPVMPNPLGRQQLTPSHKACR